jgi:hypothetical protein
VPEKIREKAAVSAIGFAMLKGKCIPFLHPCDSPPSQTLVIIDAANRVLRRDGKFSARLLAWLTKEERRFLHNRDFPIVAFRSVRKPQGKPMLDFKKTVYFQRLRSARVA